MENFYTVQVAKWAFWCGVVIAVGITAYIFLKPTVTVDPKSQLATPIVTQSSPAPVSNEDPAVKKSATGLCHAQGTEYYAQTKNFIAYDSMASCVASGGKRE